MLLHWLLGLPLGRRQPAKRHTTHFLIQIERFLLHVQNVGVQYRRVYLIFALPAYCCSMLLNLSHASIAGDSGIPAQLQILLT